MGTYHVIRIIFLLFLLSINRRAITQLQDLRFEHLSSKQGLSHNSVISIQQDKEGFLWFGTIDGLNKYNGYTFTVFRPDPKNPKNTFRDKYIFDIHEDRAGRLWAATTGLHLVNKRTGKVTAYMADSTRFNYVM
jgi:ligand-binding sensor domain-containing protein